MNGTNFKFSVSMCVYGKDNAIHFDAAINSVIEQTVKPTEIVLVVDGPIPSLIETVIDKYIRQLRETAIDFKVIRLGKNVGHGEARRKGINHCSSSFIALMDADDLSVPKRFEKQMQYFVRHPEVSVVGGYITEFITAKSPTDTAKRVGNRIVPENDWEIKRYMRKRCPMNQVTVMFRKEDVSEVGGYMDWYCEEDYYLWIRLALAGKIFGNIPENLVYVRVGAEMYQRRGGIKYFKSEVKLQKLMFYKRMIGIVRFCMNVTERFILQVAMPNKIRSLVFQKLARKDTRCLLENSDNKSQCI